MADLTTTAKVKEQLGIPTATTTYDTLIAGIVTDTSAQVEAFCNRNFLEASYTQYFDTCYGDTKLFLKNYPVSSITTVKYRGGNYGTPTWYSYPTTEYLLNAESGKISFAGKMPEAERFIQAIYTGGYKIDFAHEGTATHTLPTDLTTIVTDLCATSYNLLKTGGIASESTEGQSVTYKDITEEMTQKRLSRYRNYNI